MESKLETISELKIEVFGRVQGVMFRNFVKENADKLGVKGFVINKDEGSVLIICQGRREVLEDFLKVISAGSQLSSVEGVSYFWKKKERDYENFIIALDKGLIEDQKSSFLNLGRKILGIKGKIPKHVAIIPDGNRRWARARGMEGIRGHRIAATGENFKSLLEEAKNLGINYLTFWTFSTENWNRSKKEIDNLFRLFLDVIKDFKEESVKKEIRFRHFGRKDRLPEKLVKAIDDLEKSTEKFDKLNVQICLDYGGRDEIVRALNKAIRAGVQEIKEDDFVNYLDSSGIPDPDLIIRTSGEKRMSGFMSFQSAYSEFYFTDVHFPDFNAEELRNAVQDFSNRRRNFGGN
ncbi:MAG: polyprenyl diphosphate synthase [Candidatus Pacearchaeota archaeon]|nr:polyprenyl diphosphate synthase [Candidatus Pacearchaeota archaeon]